MFDIIAGIVIPISVTLAAVFCGFWRAETDASKVLQRTLDETEDEQKAEIEKLREQYTADLAVYKRLAHDAADRANRLAAMNQGLTEDLAALKSYNPEEVEERLKKIREIKANEERQKAEKELQALLFRMAAAQMSMPYGGITGAQSISSWVNEQGVMWR